VRTSQFSKKKKGREKKRWPAHHNHICLIGDTKERREEKSHLSSLPRGKKGAVSLPFIGKKEGGLTNTAEK